VKVQISLTDENGKVFEGEAELAPVRDGRTVRARPKKEPNHPRVARTTKLDFRKPERAFFNSYAKDLGGSKKFVLVVSYLAKGQVGKEVQLGEVSKRWNKMTSLLGGKFNRFYSGSAKDQGWVDAPKKGTYVLTESWKEAFDEGNGEADH
jgi:hypothetical protein